MRKRNDSYVCLFLDLINFNTNILGKTAKITVTLVMLVSKYLWTRLYIQNTYTKNIQSVIKILIILQIWIV